MEKKEKEYSIGKMSSFIMDWQNLENHTHHQIVIHQQDAVIWQATYQMSYKG